MDAEVRTRRLDEGFTLIELLVVVLIIGILTAIAIPVFLGQQNSAKDAQVEHDLTIARIALVSYSVAHNGDYLTSANTPPLASDLLPYGFTETVGTSGFTVHTTATGIFCISEVSASAGTPVWSETDTTSPNKSACS